MRKGLWPSLISNNFIDQLFVDFLVAFFLCFCVLETNCLHLLNEKKIVNLWNFSTACYGYYNECKQ